MFSDPVEIEASKVNKYVSESELVRGRKHAKKFPVQREQCLMCLPSSFKFHLGLSAFTNLYFDCKGHSSSKGAHLACLYLSGAFQLSYQKLAF